MKIYNFNTIGWFWIHTYMLEIRNIKMHGNNKHEVQDKVMRGEERGKR